MFRIIIMGFLAHGALALTEEQVQLMNSLHSECTAQSGVSEDVISQARNGDFVQDDKLKCFMKCVFDELGVIGDDGKLDIDGMLAILPEEMKDFAEPVIKKCDTQAGSDLCDAIFNTMKCYYESDKRALFLP